MIGTRRFYEETKRVETVESVRGKDKKIKWNIFSQIPRIVDKKNISYGVLGELDENIEKVEIKL